MESPKIVLVGHVCIDRNTTENATYTSWGSSVIYMAEYLRATGVGPVQVLSSYGPDLLEYVPAISLLPESPNQPQTLQYENDTRSLPRIWKAHNTQFAPEPPLAAAAIQALQSADIVVVATLLPNYSPAYIKTLLGYTKAGCLTVLCPQGYLRDIQPDGLVTPRRFVEAAAIVPQFAITIFSEEDTPGALELAKDWHHQGSDNTIIVTQGPKGASYTIQGGLRHVPTVALDPEEIIDSVGCGDIFAITAASSYYRNHDMEQAIKDGHKAASAKLRAATPAASTQLAT